MIIQSDLISSLCIFFLTIYNVVNIETPVTMCGGGTAVSVNIDKL